MIKENKHHRTFQPVLLVLSEAHLLHGVPLHWSRSLVSQVTYWAEKKEHKGISMCTNMYEPWACLQKLWAEFYCHAASGHLRERNSGSEVQGGQQYLKKCLSLQTRQKGCYLKTTATTPPPPRNKKHTLKSSEILSTLWEEVAQVNQRDR